MSGNYITWLLFLYIHHYWLLGIWFNYDPEEGMVYGIDISYVFSTDEGGIFWPLKRVD